MTRCCLFGISVLISGRVTICWAFTALIAFWIVLQPNSDFGCKAKGKGTYVKDVLFSGLQDVLSSCQQKLLLLNLLSNLLSDEHLMATWGTNLVFGVSLLGSEF